MENMMNEAVVDILSNPKTTTRRRRKITKTRCHDDGNRQVLRLVRRLSLCVDRQRAAVVANDENEHGHTFNIENKTRRKVGYRHMFRVVNGGPGEKEFENASRNASETGVRASSQTINTWDSWRRKHYF
jgi:hypothetical protein